MEPISDSGVDIAPLAIPEPERTNRLPLIAVGIAVLLIAGLVGVVVLSRGDSRSPGERVAAVQEAVKEAQTFKIEMVSVSTAGPTTINVAMDGAVDVDRQAASLVMKLGNVNMEMITDGANVFVRLPPAAVAQYGKQWGRVDNPGAVLGSTGGVGLGSTNPLEQLRQLEFITGEVQEIGEEEIRGTDATHFRTTLDLSKAIPPELTANIPAEAASSFESLKNVPYDIWLDDDDRPVRQKFSFEMQIPGATGIFSGAMTNTSTIDMFDFGEAVDVVVPSAEDAVTLTQAQLGQALAGIGS